MTLNINQIYLYDLYFILLT